MQLQIRQRVSRQADMLDNVKEKANSTLNSLKRKLDNLEDLVTTNSATTRAISGLNPGMEGDTSLNEVKGFVIHLKKKISKDGDQLVATIVILHPPMVADWRVMRKLI